MLQSFSYGKVQIVKEVMEISGVGSSQALKLVNKVESGEEAVILRGATEGKAEEAAASLRAIGASTYYFDNPPR